MFNHYYYYYDHMIIDVRIINWANMETETETKDFKPISNFTSIQFHHWIIINLCIDNYGRFARRLFSILIGTCTCIRIHNTYKIELWMTSMYFFWTVRVWVCLCMEFEMNSNIRRINLNLEMQNANKQKNNVNT